MTHDRPTRPGGAIQYPQLPDAELLALCLQDDQQAWEVLVRRFSRLVYSVPRRYGFQGEAADDVMQAVFLQLHRNLDSLQQRSRIAGWLATVAQRETINYLRRQRNEASLPADPAHEAGEVADDLERWERQHHVREGLRRLGGRCERLLFALFFQRGTTDYPRLARELDMPVGSIGPTRTRCFEKLRPILQKMGYRPEP